MIESTVKGKAPLMYRSRRGLDNQSNEFVQELSSDSFVSDVLQEEEQVHKHCLILSYFFCSRWY